LVQLIEAGGHRLEVERVEAARRRIASPATLVLLHEGLGSVALWKDFPARLVERTGFPAVLYSRYGYGHSDPLQAPRSVDYMHREALETLPELLAKLAIRNPILIGHSDGASIAVIYAGAHAGPLLGAVLMAPHVFVEDITVASIAQAKARFETTDLASRLARYHQDPAASFRGWSDIWLHPAFRSWNIEQYLPHIAVPLLLLQGSDDQYGTRAQIEAILRQLSSPVESILLERCTHSPHVDQADATLDAIAGFVDKLVTGPHQPSASSTHDP
jgi:pimeloyl-ACP methyl ester carboxylesterase